MQNLLIKSTDRLSGSSSDFVMYSTLVLEGKYLVKHAMLPNTIYNVNTANNRFTLYDGGLFLAVELPVGNYNLTTFAAALTVAINDTSPFGAPYAAVIDTLTFKLTITNAGLAPFSLDFGSTASRQLLGFADNVTPSAHPLAGEGVVNLGTPESIGIQIVQSNTRNYENLSTDCTGTIYVPLNKAFGSYLSLPSHDLPQWVNFARRDRHLHVRLVNTSNNAPVDLNGGEYEILLSKEC